MLQYQQAVANESGINFISVKGPELLNMVSFLYPVYVLLTMLFSSLVCRRKREGRQAGVPEGTRFCSLCDLL